MSTGTALFVYGTLRHDRPEHARYCRGVEGWQPARVRGRLFRLAEGYLLLVLPPAAILHRASADATADECRRRAMTSADLERAAATLEEAGCAPIDGELLAFRDPAAAWPPLDRWEGASWEKDAVYARVVVPVETGDPARLRVAAWIYAATQAPAGAEELVPPVAD